MSNYMIDEKLRVKNYEDVKGMLNQDEFISDEDKTWWEGVLYGIFLCGVISSGQKEESVESLIEIQKKNIKTVNRGIDKATEGGKESG